MKRVLILTGCILVFAATLTAQATAPEAVPIELSVYTIASEFHPLTTDGITYEVSMFTSPLPGNPDAMIKNEDDVTYIGENIYNLDGSFQTKEQEVTPGDTAIYFVKVENKVEDGRTKDNITLRGPGDEPDWTVKYFDPQGGGDITSSVTTSGWSTGPLDPHEDRLIIIEVTPSASGPEETSFEVLVTAQSTNDGARKDAVKAVTTVTGAVEESSPNSFEGFLLEVPWTLITESTVRYTLPYDSDASLVVYDAAGKAVSKLVSEKKPAGEHTATWYGLDSQGRPLPQGVYFCTLKAGTFVQTQKMVLLR